jgi:outer membrane lipoprotein-sorting protein
MTYISNDYEIKPKREIVKPEDVFSIPINKIYEIESEDKFRERPPSGNSGASLYYFEMIAKYLRYTNLWDIEKQNEELLSHNTVVLYGTIDKSLVNTMQPDESSFRFWVDKDTGILLKYEIYNGKGEILSYLHPESLKVNVAIDSTQFIPVLDNYNEMQIDGPLFKDS